MTVNDNLRDILTERQINILRKRKRTVSDNLAILIASIGPLTPLLTDFLNQLENKATIKQQLDFSNKYINEVIAPQRENTWSKINREFTQDYEESSKEEARYTALAIAAAIPFLFKIERPQANQFPGPLFNRPIQGFEYSTWLDNLPKREVQAIKATIRMGVMEGASPRQLIGRVIGRTGVIRTKSFRDLKITTETLLSYAENAGRTLTYLENDFINEEIYSAILDGRTSLICASLDGKRFPVGEGKFPPQHLGGCRSIRLPVIEGQEILSDRNTITSKDRFSKINFTSRARKRIGTEEFRKLTKSQQKKAIRQEKELWAARVVGKVPQKTTYNAWLKTRSPEFQDDVLGKTKGKLFRQGNLNLDKFVDNSGKTLTLDQLKQEIPKVFDKIEDK